MQIVKEKISRKTLEKMAQNLFGDMVKAVIDVEREIMVLDGELHADEETRLLETGSRQENLWGINLYPKIKDETWIEFDSMINLRPSMGNLTRGVDNPKTRKKIINLVNKLVDKNDPT